MKRREYSSPKICINKDAGYRGIGPTVVMIDPVIVPVRLLSWRGYSIFEKDFNYGGECL